MLPGLFDKLETELKNSPQKNLLTDLFGGKLCNQLIGRSGECSHVKEKSEPFFNIQVT